MFTLLLSLGASVLGPAGILLGLLSGLLLDQVAIIWVWERQLVRFLREGRPLKWFRGLEARLIFLRWWFPLVELDGARYSGAQQVFKSQILRQVLGVWGLVPSLIRTSRTVILELLERSVADGGNQAWHGAGSLRPADKEWLWGTVLQACSAVDGITPDMTTTLVSLGLELGMKPKAFKARLMAAPLLPQDFVRHYGLPAGGAGVSEEAVLKLIDTRANGSMEPEEVRAFVHGQFALRDRIVDGYAEACLETGW